MKTLRESLFDQNDISSDEIDEAVIWKWLDENTDYDKNRTTIKNGIINVNGIVTLNNDVKEIPEHIIFGRVDRFVAEYCTELDSIKGFPKHADEIWCDCCVNLKKIDRWFTDVNIISFFGCENLTDISGLKSIKSSCDVDLSLCPIKNLKGLPPRIRDLNCSECVNLTSFEGCPDSLLKINCAHCDKIHNFKHISKKLQSLVCEDIRIDSMEGLPSRLDYIFLDNSVVNSLKGIDYVEVMSVKGAEIYDISHFPQVKSLYGGELLVSKNPELRKYIEKVQI